MEIWNKLSPAGDDAELLHVATYLPLKGWRHVIPFLAMSMRIEKQLKHSSGVVSYGLRAKVANRHFWTLSIWTEPEAHERVHKFRAAPNSGQTICPVGRQGRCFRGVGRGG